MSVYFPRIPLLTTGMIRRDKVLHLETSATSYTHHHQCYSYTYDIMSGKEYNALQHVYLIISTIYYEVIDQLYTNQPNVSIDVRVLLHSDISTTLD